METLVPKYQILICFVDLKPNLAFLYNKGHNFWKSVSTWKIPQNWIICSCNVAFTLLLPTELHLLPLMQPLQARASKQAESATQ